MSATHRSTRPKGYLQVITDGRSGEGEWKPSADVMDLINTVRSVLAEYSSYGPMTVRQIFYRLVGQHGYAKDERAYKRLAETLVKARRAQLIGFHSIRDDGTITHYASGETTRKDVWKYLHSIVSRPSAYLHLDRNTGQPYHVELWCEAGGMAPMLAQMVRSRDVSVYSTGGFSSVTVTHEVAQRVIRRERPTYFMHVGDYDPSGESIFTSMSQDIGAFVAGHFGSSWQPATGLARNEGDEDWFVPKRVALTENQVAEFDLPTAPPKLSDSRSAAWIGETTQAEAMPPDLLERVVLEALAKVTDEDALKDLKERERTEKNRVQAAVDDQSVVEIIEGRGLSDPSLLELVEALSKYDLES